MDSLVTEISCSLNLNHQKTSTRISHSPPHPISSAARPPTTTTSLLSADKSKKSASPLLPLPPSRPLFPSPLKFLWFGRDHNPPSKPSENSPVSSEVAEIDTENLPSTSKTCTCFTTNECNASDAELMDINHIKSAEGMPKTSQQNTATDSLTQGYSNESTTYLSTEQGNSNRNTANLDPGSASTDKSWMSRFLWSRSLWKAASDPDLNSRELVKSALLIAATEADQALRVAATDSDCIDNDNDKEIDSGCGWSDDEQWLCMLQESHIEKRVVHDRQSVSAFLHEVPVAEVQAISRLCLLSNLAYIIPEVQSKHLLKDHQLSFVTSSIIKKEEAEAKVALERSAIHASKQNNRGVKRKLKTQEENTVSIVASCVDEAFDKSSSSSELTMHTKAILEEETIILASQSQDVKAAEEESDLEETKNKADREATSKEQGSCPCEWFICDDEASSTRYLVVQGSESLASWQTNLSFAPTKFEGLGVLVHRGVYEAAQKLYKMVEREIEEHIRKGSHTKVCFTGHSLGGSLATLLAMMLVKRGVVSTSAVEGVVTLGAPCVLCTGERLLGKLGLQERQFMNVVMHRDIVPRAFACDYPDHIARLLKRVNSTFRDHPCLNFQRLLYAPVGQVMILQPDDAQSPSHPLLPTIAGLYLIKHPHRQDDMLTPSQAAMEVREVQRAFFNMPHPLDMLRDPGAYGFEGAISRDHDPRSYKRAINTVISQGMRRQRRLGRQRRLQLWWTSLSPHTIPSPSCFNPHLPLMGGPLDQPSPHLAPCASSSSSLSPSSPRKHLLNRSSRLIASQHIHMGLLLILSIPMDLFSSFLSWT